MFGGGHRAFILDYASLQTVSDDALHARYRRFNSWRLRFLGDAC